MRAMLVTLKVKHKKPPSWQYVTAPVLCIASLFFEAWLAVRFLGLQPYIARQAVVVFSVLLLIFFPLLYRAHQARFRNRDIRATKKVVVAFIALMFLAMLYYFDKAGVLGNDPVTKRVTVGFALISAAIGLAIAIFGIKYEFE